MDPGSTTFSCGPTKSRQKMAAIGVTYSWLKRMSVRTNPSSPGLTYGTPTRSAERSVTQRRARTFSASVIARLAVVTAGTRTLPCIRATLYWKSPPCSMIPRVMPPSPAVNTARGIGSPRRTRSSTEKSVLVKTPRFWQFSR